MNISETAVAEFMIALAEESANVDKFKQVCSSAGNYACVSGICMHCYEVAVAVANCDSGC